MVNLDFANKTIYHVVFSFSSLLKKFLTYCRTRFQCIIQSFTNLFMLFTHQFVLADFLNAAIYCFFHIFQSKFLAYFFFRHIFILIISFQLNQEFLVSQLISLRHFPLIANNIKKQCFFSKMFDIIGFLNFLCLLKIK